MPIAVIGGGSIGLRHATQAMGNKAVHLTAVVEPDANRRAELRALGAPAVAGMDDVPASTRAAVVATPTTAHFACAQGAIDMGWAVLVEKPLTHSLTEAALLCDAAEQNDLPLFTGHHRRCHPTIIEARAMLPRIGDLVGLNGVWALRKHDTYFDTAWRRQQGAGPVMTNLSHEIDLLRFLAGEITAVSALTSNARRGLPVEDTAAISFRFACGALGTFLISDAGASPWAFEATTGENPAIAASGQDALQVIGTRGAISCPSMTLWSGDGTGAVDWRAPLRPTPGPPAPVVDPINEQLTRFARAVAGESEPLLATGRDGMATLAVTQAVLTSASSGRVEQVPVA